MNNRKVKYLTMEEYKSRRTKGITYSFQTKPSNLEKMARDIADDLKFPIEKTIYIVIKECNNGNIMIRFCHDRR